MKKFVTFAFITLFSGFAFALGLMDISITPQAGILNGKVQEYVIDEDCLNTDNVLSRLDWETLLIPYIGLDADVTILDYIYLNMNGKFAFHKSSGTMQDYDWLNSINPNWADDDPTEVTNYSSSRNILDEYNTIALRAGANLPLPFQISIKPFVSYEYEMLGYTAYGGKAKYKSMDYVEFQLSADNERTISYKQETNALFLGLGLNVDTLSFLSFKADFLVSPYLTWISCLDMHYLRSQAFYDKLENVFQLKGDLSVFYNIDSNNSFGISGFVQYIPLASGTDYIAAFNSMGQIITEWIPDDSVEGGTERFFWAISLVYKLSF
ncbi:MAG: omptin family outer membrane protease [Treponema sp.]|nr:omptin family outer membrane protease [Treponema sp.]